MSRIRSFVVLALALALVLSARAEGRFALVIGNGDYLGLPKLHNPANDAEDMGAALKKLGFSTELLLDADCAAMEEAVTRLGNRLSVDCGSIGFFYYAGHGVQSAGENYLIPADAKIPSEAYLGQRSLPVQALLSTLAKSGNALNVVVLDACRDNPFSWGRSSARGLSIAGSVPPGSIIAYATSAGSIAQDGTGRNGIFTAALLQHIVKPGIELKEAFNLTGAAVKAATGGAQIPAIYSQQFDAVYLAGAPAPTAEPQAAVAKAAEPAITIVRDYGSLRIEAARPGQLFVDGEAVGDIGAGATTLANVPAGSRRVELRYADGKTDTTFAIVSRGAETRASLGGKPLQAAAPAPAAIPAAAVPAPAATKPPAPLVPAQDALALARAERREAGKALYYPAVPFVKRDSISFNGQTYTGGAFWNDRVDFAKAAERAIQDDPEVRRLSAEYQKRVSSGKAMYWAGIGGMLVGGAVFMGDSLAATYGAMAPGLVISIWGALRANRLPKDLIDRVNALDD